MWHETPGWEQQGSFVQPVPIPSAGIDDAPQVCVQVNAEWLPYVLGSLMQLAQPSSWIAPSQAALDDVLGRATDLIAEIGNAVTCSCPILRLHNCILQVSCDLGVTWTDATDWDADFQECVSTRTSPPIPPNPGGVDQGQNACNLAGYLASQVLQKAAAAQAANRAAANDQNSLIKSLINDVFMGSPFINGIVDAGYAMFVTTQSFPNTDLVTASTDAGLLAQLTQAIFIGTNGIGYVNASNFAQVAVNIAAISYPAASWVPTMLANFWTNLTLATIQSMQAIGAVNSADCSSFDVDWCFTLGFNVQSWATAALAVNNSQYHMSWDGTAWVANGPGLGGQSWGDLLITNVASSSTPFTITYLEIGVSRAQANTDGAVDSFALAFHGATLVGSVDISDTALGAGVYSNTFPGGIATDGIFIKVFADGGDLRIDYVKMRGTGGPSPWGASNCV